MQEEWKDIPSFEGIYQVSNLGNVRSVDRYVKNGEVNLDSEGRLYRSKKLTPTKIGNLLVIILYRKRVQTRLSLGKLVATLFVDNPNNYHFVYYKDENIYNNIYTNLAWRNKTYAYKETSCNRVKVIQYTKDKEKIKEWGSITEASASLGISKSNISLCTRGKTKSAGGYIWEKV